MTLGLIGKKIGMTRVFTDQGESQPVTVVEATPNRITQIKTVPVDGYYGVQVTVGERRPNRVSKAMQGHFAKAGAEPGRGVWEFRLTQPFEQPVAPQAKTDSDAETETEAETDTKAETTTDAETATDTKTETTTDAKPATETVSATELTVDMFSQGQKVDVTGRSIGKGFAGVVKRYGFKGGRASHGTSKAHRSGGSIGNAQDPGRVFKGKKMAGHMGDRRRVQQGLEVIRVDSARNLLLISGAIPGAKGGNVIIQPSVKTKNSSPAKGKS